MALIQFLQYLAITCGTKYNLLHEVYIALNSLAPAGLLSFISNHSFSSCSHFAPDILAFSLSLEQRYPTLEIARILFPLLKIRSPLFSTCKFSLTSLRKMFLMACSGTVLPSSSHCHSHNSLFFLFTTCRSVGWRVICMLNCLILFFRWLCDLRPGRSRYSQSPGTVGTVLKYLLNKWMNVFWPTKCQINEIKLDSQMRSSINRLNDDTEINWKVLTIRAR